MRLRSGDVAGDGDGVGVDLGASNARVLALARAQSRRHRASGSSARGSRWSRAPAGWTRAARRSPIAGGRRASGVDADAVLHRDRCPPAGRPRRASRTASASSPGRRSTTSHELPEQLIVVGSGVTGAEFASAYQALGSTVDAGLVARPGAAGRGRRRRAGARGRVPAARHDGAEPVAGGLGGAHRRRRRGHAGRRPHGRGLALPDGGRRRSRTPRASAWRRPGSRLDDRAVRRGRPGVAHVGAAACTPPATAPACCMLASVAAMQGRIAMWHALGDAVAPLDLKTVSSNVFTDPEIATVGVTQADVDAGASPASVGQAAAGHQRAGEDAGHHGRLREAVRPHGTAHRASAASSSPRAPAS